MDSTVSSPQRLIPMAEVRFSDEELEAALEVLRSGKLAQGEMVRAFEEAFAHYVGVRYAVAASSGTAALHLAYLAVLEPGGEVLVPTFTHISTASMIHFAGCRPVFCDIDPRTFTMDVEDARRRVTPRTRAVVPVHLFGNACKVEEILAFAQEHGLRVVWDACQAHGTRYQGRDVGSLDDLACYSFYPTKNLFVGEGGMVTTNDPALYEKLKLLRSHGQTRKYYHTLLGFNYRMTEVEAALGLSQLGRLEHLTERRRANAAFLDRGLGGLPGVQAPWVSDGVRHVYHQYSILLDERVERDTLVASLHRQGVETGVHYPLPLHLQPALASYAGGVRLPVSEEVARRILSLPVHPGLSQEDLEQVVGAVRAAIQG